MFSSASPTLHDTLAINANPGTPQMDLKDPHSHKNVHKHKIDMV